MLEFFNENNDAEAVVHIYSSEINAIIAEAKRFHSSETGGDLYGSFTHGNMPVIWLASGPGPKAKLQSMHFEQDVKFTNFWQQYLSQNFGIQYIGSWHSHHTLSLNQPSQGDVNAAQIYARKHGRRKTLEIIVNHEGRSLNTIPRPYFYPNAVENSWVKTKFACLNSISPLRGVLKEKESNFSPHIDFRALSGTIIQNLPSSQVNDTRSSESNDEDNYPPLLLEAVNLLDSDKIEGIEVEQRSNTFMVIISCDDKKTVAIVLTQSRNLQIIQINLINRTQNQNIDITNKIKQKGFSFILEKQNARVLKDIFSKIQYMQV